MKSQVQSKKTLIEDKKTKKHTAFNNRTQNNRIVVIDHSEGSEEDQNASDHDEFIVHNDGNEEIHITRKAKRQLKMPVAHFKTLRPQT